MTKYRIYDLHHENTSQTPSPTLNPTFERNIFQSEVVNLESQYSHYNGFDFNGTHFFMYNAYPFHTNIVEIFDIDGNYITTLGTPAAGSGVGEFDVPYCASPTTDFILVCDFSNDRIQVFNKNGAYADSFDGSTTLAGILNGPIDIWNNNTHMSVVDSSNARVVVFDIFANLAFEFGSNYLSNPASIDNNGTHYFVTEGYSSEIKVFSNEGTYQTNITYSQIYKNQIAVHGDVITLSSQGILQLDHQGNLLNEMPGGIDKMVSVNSSHLLGYNQASNSFRFYQTQNNLVSGFTWSEGLASNGTHFFVSDYLQDEIQVHSQQWELLSTIESSGTGVEDLFGPKDLLLVNDILYVVDEKNHRIQIFDTNGTHIGSMGSSDTLIRPQSIDFNGTYFAVSDERTTGDLVYMSIYNTSGQLVTQFGEKWKKSKLEN